MALATGFALILLVAVITVFRSGSLSFDKKNSDSGASSAKDSRDLSKNYSSVSTSDLQKKIGSQSSIVLLDARSFEDYAKEHIMGSINMTSDDFPIADKIDASKPIVIIGASGTDGSIDTIAQELKKENLNNFSVLSGGMDAWDRLVGLTVTYGDPTSFVDQSKVSYVEADSLKAALDAKAPMFILDVRTTDEFSQGHIPGAINIPFEDLEKRHSEVPAFERIVVSGVNELQEFQAAVQLYDMNAVSPFVLKGAISQWQQKNYPLDK